MFLTLKAIPETLKTVKDTLIKMCAFICAIPAKSFGLILFVLALIVSMAEKANAQITITNGGAVTFSGWAEAANATTNNAIGAGVGVFMALFALTLIMIILKKSRRG